MPLTNSDLNTALVDASGSIMEVRSGDVINNVSQSVYLVGGVSGSTAKVLKLDSSGALYVTGTIATIGGGVASTVAQGNAGSAAQSWFVEITDGSKVLGTGSSAPLFVTGSVGINSITSPVSIANFPVTQSIKIDQTITLPVSISNTPTFTGSVGVASIASPVNVTSSFSFPVWITGSVTTAAATIGTITQGNAGAVSQSWFVEITDGTKVLGTGSSAPLFVTGSATINSIASTVTTTGSVGITSIATPVNVTSSFAFPVWITGSVTTAAATIGTVAQGNQGTIGNSWFVEITDGSKVLGTGSSAPLFVTGSVGVTSIASPISIGNFPVTQSVKVDASITLPVSVSNTPTITGSVGVTSIITPVSVTSSFAFPVWVTGSVLTAVGPSTVTQGPAGSIGNSWFVEITDGSKVLGTGSSAPLFVTGSVGITSIATPVAISNLPVTQSVKIDQTITLPVSISNTPTITGSVTVNSIASTVNITGSATINSIASTVTTTGSVGITSIASTVTTTGSTTINSIASPVSVTSSFAFPVWVTGSVLTSATPSTVTQGNQGSVGQSWFVEITDGTKVLGTGSSAPLFITGSVGVTSIASPVSIGNFPVTQSVKIDASITLPVSISNTPTITGSVTVNSIASTVATTGSVTVNSIATPVTITGTVAQGNAGAVGQSWFTKITDGTQVLGTGSSAPLFVTGTVGVTSIASPVSVGNFPVTQSVKIDQTITLPVSVSNTPIITGSVGVTSIASIVVTTGSVGITSITSPVNVTSSFSLPVWVTGSVVNAGGPVSQGNQGTVGQSWFVEITDGSKVLGTGSSAPLFATGSVGVSSIATPVNIGNFPVTQSVKVDQSITLPVSISNTPTITGSVTVNSIASVVTTTGSVGITSISSPVAISNLPVTQSVKIDQSITLPVSISNIPTITGSVTVNSIASTVTATGSVGITSVAAPVSVTSSFAFPVWVTGSVLTAAAPSTVTQGPAGSIGSSWFVEITDGSKVLGTGSSAPLFVTGSVGVTSIANTVNITGSATINSIASTVTTTGSVTVNSIASTVSVTGSIGVTSIASPVSIANFPVTQSVKIDQTITLPVSVSNTPTITGSVGVTSIASIVATTGSVTVNSIATPVNVTSSFNFPVWVTGSVLTSAAPSTVTQGNAGTVGQSWFVEITDGSKVLGTGSSAPLFVTGTVGVSSIASTVTITGSVFAFNNSATPHWVTGSVTVSSPVTQSIKIDQSITLPVSISNTPTITGSVGITSIASTVTTTGSVGITSIASPVNVTSSFAFPVWVTGSVLTAAAPSTVTQGNAGSIGQSWFVEITDGSKVLGTGSSAPLFVTGSVGVTSIASTVNITGSATINSIASTVTTTGSVGITSIASPVSIANFPVTQSVKVDASITLPVSVSNTPTITGSVTVNSIASTITIAGTVAQGNAGSVGQSWFTKITDGAQVLGTGSSAPFWVTGSKTINSITTPVTVTASAAFPVAVTGTVGITSIASIVTTTGSVGITSITSPVSVTSSFAFPVWVTGSVLTAAAPSTVTQGPAGSIGSSWFVEITDGSKVLGTGSSAPLFITGSVGISTISSPVTVTASAAFPVGVTGTVGVSSIASIVTTTGSVGVTSIITPVSVTSSFAFPVWVTGSVLTAAAPGTQTVTGTVGVTSIASPVNVTSSLAFPVWVTGSISQGQEGVISDSWFTKITDGTQVLGTGSSAPLFVTGTIGVSSITSPVTVTSSLAFPMWVTGAVAQGTPQTLSNPWPVLLSSGSQAFGTTTAPIYVSNSFAIAPSGGLPTNIAIIGGFDNFSNKVRPIRIDDNGYLLTKPAENEPTFITTVTGVLIAQNKSMFSLINSGTAAQSPLVVKIRQINIVNAQTSIVAGITANFELRRIVSHSAGENQTPQPFDTNDVLDSRVTAKTGSTVVTETTTLLNRVQWNSDELLTSLTASNANLEHASQATIPLWPFPGSNQKPLILRNNQGFTVKQTVNSTVGSFDISVIFTTEDF